MSESAVLDDLGGVLRGVAALELVEEHGSLVTTLAFDVEHGGMLVLTANDDELALRAEAQLVAPLGQYWHDVGTLWPWRAFVGRQLMGCSVVRSRGGHLKAIQLRFAGSEAVVEVSCIGPLLLVAAFTPTMPALAPPEGSVRETELLAAIRDAFDDDTPRLVWGDLVGGERGELVAVQCRLARGEDPVLRARERYLLELHGDAWAGELRGVAKGWEYRRGFVEAIEVDARTFIEHAAAIVVAAPLARSLTIAGLRRFVGFASVAEFRELDPLEVLDRLFELPELVRFDRLAFVRAEINTLAQGQLEIEGHGDAIASRLVASGVLGRLRALAISGCHLSAAGRQTLVTAGLGHLERMWLRSEDGEPPRFL